MPPTPARRSPQERADRRLAIEKLLGHQTPDSEIVHQVVKDFGITEAQARRDIRGIKSRWLNSIKEKPEELRAQDIAAASTLLRMAIEQGKLSDGARALELRATLQGSFPKQETKNDKDLATLTQLAMQHYAAQTGGALGAKAGVKEAIEEAKADEPRTVDVESKF